MKKFFLPVFYRSFFYKIISICFLLLLFTYKASAQKDYKAIEQQLNHTIDTSYSNYKVPGIIVGIWTPEFTFTKVVGKADVKTGVDRKLDDKIRIGSITKTFVATVILQLVDEGKLSLDDKLDKYYPQVPNSSSITLRQVLDMTGGIPDYLDDPLLLQSMLYDRLNKFTSTELLDATIALKPSFEPGKGWKYSNGSYNILGMLIEKITVNKLEDEIDSRIIKPLGLVNTSFPTSPYMEGQYSHGYMENETTKVLEDVTVIDPSITWAAGCMVSNIDDLKIYAKALADGIMISKSSQEERLKFVNTGLSDYQKYGLGIIYLDGFIGHTGAITGYSTTMFYHPELKAMFIVSVNEFGNDKAVADNIFVELAGIVYPEKNLFQ